MALIENWFYMSSLALLAVYFMDSEPEHLLAAAILIPSCLACCINLCCPLIEQTPCNSTMLLLSKILCVLRFFVGLSVFIRFDRAADWDWSITFWPYWCSFAIQVILSIASMVILANTISNYFRQEAIIEDSKVIFSLSY